MVLVRNSVRFEGPPTAYIVSEAKAALLQWYDVAVHNLDKPVTRSLVIGALSQVDKYYVIQADFEVED